MRDLCLVTPPPPITRGGKVRNTSQTFMTASTLSAKLADGNDREFFWGCTVSKEEPEYTWSCLDEDNDTDFLEQTLFVKHATLGAAAVEKERNIVIVETKSFDGAETKLPIVSLTCGVTECSQLDLVFQHEVPFTLRLVSGTGPVHFCGNQLVAIPFEDNYGTETETEYTENEDTEEDEDEEEEEEEEEEVEMPTKKRKVPIKGNKKKRGKMESVKYDTEEDEEFEENMEADTTGESGGESEESSEEEEEEGSSPTQPCEVVIRTVKPKKVGRKAKSVKVVAAAAKKAPAKKGRKARK